MDPRRQPAAILVIIPHPIYSMGYMRSQVLGQFRYLASLGYKVTLLSVGDVQAEPVRQFREVLEAAEISPAFIPPSSQGVINYLKALKICRTLLEQFHFSAIYTREVWGALVAAKCKILSSRPDVKLIYDVRGAVPEEILFGVPGWKGKLKSHFFSYLEKRAVVNATALNCVTPQLSEHIFKRYGKKADTLVPCCVESLLPTSAPDRTLMRQQFGFENHNVVYVYSGGLSHWQLFRETLELFSSISSCDENARFLILTPELSRAEQMLSQALPSLTYRVMSVSQEHVATHLQAGDVGILLRDTNIVNEVAFPIKFAEYLAAGLPVISTPGVPVIADIIRRNNLGMVLTELNNSSLSVANWGKKVRRDKSSWSSRCRDFVNEHLTWRAHQSNYSILYDHPGEKVR